MSAGTDRRPDCWRAIARLGALPGAAAVLALLTALASTQAVAHEYSIRHLTIHHPWSRALPAVVRNGAVYMRVHNRDTRAERLLSAAAPAIAARVELHTHLHDNGIMRMRRLPAIDLPAARAIALAPGGMHLMLFGLAAPLVAGTTFTLALTFERAGTIEVEVQVEHPDVQVYGPR